MEDLHYGQWRTSGLEDEGPQLWRMEDLSCGGWKCSVHSEEEVLNHLPTIHYYIYCVQPSWAGWIMYMYIHQLVPG